MSEVKELENKLKELKDKELKERWEIYLDKIKTFLNSTKGKTILRWHSNGNFVIFRILDYKEQYYMDENGAMGQWHPSRWFELITTQTLSVRVADNMGRYFDPGIDASKPFEFIYSKKGKTTVSRIKILSQLDDTCLGEIKELAKVGFDEYKNNSNDPKYENSISHFLVFAQVVPDEILDDAIKIHEEHANKTKEFWEKYQQQVKDSPRLNF